MNIFYTYRLTVEELRSQSNILMDSNKQRDLHLITNLASLSLESKGGVVGGLLDTKGLHVEGKWLKLLTVLKKSRPLLKLQAYTKFQVV